MPSTYDLVGSAEAAKLLEIGPTNFSHLRKKMLDAGDESFPTPVIKLQCGPIWKLSDMMKFKKHYDARRRRVRPSNGDAPAAATPAPKAAPARAKRGKATADKMTDATVTDIAEKPKRLRVKTSA